MAKRRVNAGDGEKQTARKTTASAEEEERINGIRFATDPYTRTSLADSYQPGADAMGDVANSCVNRWRARACEHFG